MKSKALFYSILSIVAIITIGIITLCIVFILQPEGGNSNNNGSDTSSSFSFDYGNKIDLLYGDTFNLAPTNSNLPLLYVPEDTAILSVNSSGDILINKCGSTTVEIYDSSVLVKEVTISVKLNCSIVPKAGCEFIDGKLVMNTKTCCFNASIINSKNKVVVTNEIPSLTATTGISAQIKFDSFWVTAENEGTITIKFEAINGEFSLPVTLS